MMEQHRLEPRFLIDCGHGNCGKDPRRQKIAFESVVSQTAEGNHSILGIMLESHLKEGKQPLLEDPSELIYGVSITDPCLGWEETEGLLRWADESLSTSISSVQK
jgi:3-deoxy-7-phosphoheptulonate synthase